MSSHRTSRHCCCRRTRNSTISPPSTTNSTIASPTDRQALPLRTRTTRRSHPQETEAAAQRSHGRHPARRRNSTTALPQPHDRLRRPHSRGATRARRLPSSRSMPARRPPDCLRIDPAGLPFIGGALALARARRRGSAGWLLAVPFVLLGAVLRSSSSAIRTAVRRRRRRRRCCRRPTAACSSPAPAMPARAAAGGQLAADQHLPVADGRACQPHARRPGA